MHDHQCVGVSCPDVLLYRLQLLLDQSADEHSGRTRRCLHTDLSALLSALCLHWRTCEHRLASVQTDAPCQTATIDRTEDASFREDNEHANSSFRFITREDNGHANKKFRVITRGRGPQRRLTILFTTRGCKVQPLYNEML